MSAMLGSGTQWQQVRRALKPLQRDYGFTIFHGHKFKHLDGEFRGWGDQKCRSLLADIGTLGGMLTECVTVHCSHKTYRHFLEAKPPKMHRASQYGLCFEAVLDGLIVRTMEKGRQHKLSVIVESGHPNAPDTARVFEEKRRFFEGGGFDFLRSHTLVRKEDDHLLMLSDAAAYGMALKARITKAGLVTPFDHGPKEEPKDGQTGWTVANVTPQFIDRLIDNFRAERAAKDELHFKRKAAWLASKAASEEQPS